ncbi:PP2C family serine/threonine-protein phosphatase [Vulcanisaeta sp. JCM 14467]|uniref:PP2C family serine/threonine-protein phosphatase n=1 Tax=Vulcanisaeta sp. JCM 14467 TaxID=1295370 RepID=UPI0006D261CD|nr:PP2C family serine/threonine-protein phosphatase [Vulcanisaeta sp. JCM 14467]
MLKIIGVSLIGITHRRRGEPLQDFFNAYIGNPQVSNHQEGNEWVKGWFVGDGSAFVFVADGAGSARYGRDGARYAVDSAINFVRNNDLASKEPGEVLRAVLRIALEGIERRAKELNADIEDLATTFMTLYVRSHECFSVGVGDGYVIIDDGSGLKLLNEPVKGEYFNETQFITSPEVMKAIRIGRLRLGVVGAMHSPLRLMVFGQR